MVKKRDLFDDSVMTFGEHLEALRTHVIRALIGLSIGVVICLYFGEQIVIFIRQPLDASLKRKGLWPESDDIANFKAADFWSTFYFSTVGTITGEKPPTPPPPVPVTNPDETMTIKLELPAREIAEEFHKLYPDSFPAPAEELKEKTITLHASSTAFKTLFKSVENTVKPVALNVQEAFMTYLKVGFFSGLILSGPWVVYQLWLFVAAGLYPHERKYVRIYLPMSVGLFVAGAVFCYYAVFPFMLDFLIEFNVRMGINPQIRISEWVSFAVLLPVMFGVSFQLPLVMLFLNKLNVLQAKDYREQRRMAILIISIVSMVLTPSPDPMSMILMMIPLIGLYEMGIFLCGAPPKDEESTAIQSA